MITLNKSLVPDVNSQKYGIHSLKFGGSILWNNLPVNSKECQSLREFNLLLE